MLKLFTNIGFDDCNCAVTVQDMTGFQVDNPDGFFPSDQRPPYNTVDFKISDGYLFNVILKYKYNGSVEIVNLNEPILNINDADTDPVYQENFQVMQYSLPQDGTYVIKRLFIVSRAYYELISSIAPDKTLVFYDEDEMKFYQSTGIGGVETEIDLLDLAIEFNSNYVGAHTSHKLFSTCYLKQCHFKLQREFLNDRLGLNLDSKKSKRKCLIGCDDDEVSAENRDFIHTTLHVLDYLIGCGYFDDAQRLLESLNKCGSICNQVGVRNTGCGCG